MNWPFLILVIITLLSAIGTMAFRNLIHCALSLTVTLAALAGLYLHLNAQFVGLAQVLVYVGAVAVLIVFAVLLTQDTPAGDKRNSLGVVTGITLALALFTILAVAILDSVASKAAIVAKPSVTVRDVGDRLLGDYVLPLEVIGLLLTAAMIGGVLIALDERGSTNSNALGSR